jgi:heme-degrading monooxygenase HmoA
MAYIAMVTHKVKDFSAWKKTYDGVRGVQKEGGVRAHTVLRANDDPNTITVTHTFDTLPAAQAFFTSANLKKAMTEGGVDPATIKVMYYEQIATGPI